MKIALYSLNPSIEKSEQYRLLIERIGFFGAQTISVQNAEELSGADLLLSIGGDGTFLRVVNMLRGSQIPVAGINFG
ncbi:MAG: NAD(+)/NADH kinase, partial [Bacteroidales bacterium]|nr:NAD(+)/NADH kinase [Bacteroidales bacterium]